ncbi:MAG: TRZ/ATZ family hydrolase [Rhodocyclaceae bacterium]|nr:TRZ/ATZ family hydrolase [Rhodocyclaceae bacterium]
MNEKNLPSPVDLILDARWIIPIEPTGVVLEDHSLVIDQGRIHDILPQRAARERYQAKARLGLDEHVLLPGLVNAHTHAAMSLLRGYGDDLPLMTWLTERIWPAEKRFVSPRFVHDGTLLACWEMLKGGITCFNDMYFFPENAAEAVRAAGMRAVLGITVIDFPSAYAHDADDYLAKGLATRDALRDEPLMTFALAPHAPYTVSDAVFERIAWLAAEMDVPVHVHVQETRHEIEESLQRHGCRPLARLARLGLVDTRLLAVHAVHLEATEIELLAQNRCHVAHCPTSNMKLASGIAPISRLAQAGVNVCLGSDGAASNNRLDLFREMHAASLLAKVASEDPSALPAHQVLAMATLGGARALALDDRIGSLVVGKEADVIAVRLTDWWHAPYFDPASHLVHVLGREAVSHVWVAGQLRIDNGKPVDEELSFLLSSVKIWQNVLRH